ncbi:uncharacterized protein HaLaN_32303, partial [Haematococcus lacustris]
MIVDLTSAREQAALLSILFHTKKLHDEFGPPPRYIPLPGPDRSDEPPPSLIRKIVLASASPRRQQLLQQLHLNFEVVVSNFEELLPKAQFSGPEGAARYAVE